MKILKTPEERFNNLPGYSFTTNFVNVASTEEPVMMHYVDYGDKNAAIILMLHGEPTWSYLYRNMIIEAQTQGYRVIAPDLIGFGKSDKFDSQDAYTYASHLQWLERFFLALDLNNVHLICQDWGGLLGLRLVAKYPQRFTAVVAANTMLPTGDHPPPEAFLKWQRFSQELEVFPIAQVIQKATVNEVIDEVLAAYDAPFPNEAYKCAVRKFPLLVPIQPDDPEAQHNRDAWQSLRAFDKPFLTAFSDSDPITAGGEKIFQKRIPGCKGQAHVVIKNGGHFLQEDAGEELIKVSLEFFNRIT